MIEDRALKGKTALVTGGSRGIGRAICQALGARGAKVIINYRSREDAAKETAAQVAEAGGEAVLAGFDVGNAAACADNIALLGKEHGLDILVNNAGIAINGLIMRFSTSDWQRLMDVNTASVFHCVKAASRQLLRAKEHGRIINITSVVGEMGNGGQAAYAASKAAIIGLTKSLAREFASRGLCANAVSPGYIETDMTSKELPEAIKQKLLKEIPLARIGKVNDVANMVAFLAGPEASYITGQVMRINGGLLL